MKPNEVVFLLLLLPFSAQAESESEILLSKVHQIQTELDKTNAMLEQLISDFDSRVMPELEKQDEELRAKHEEWRKEHGRDKSAK